MIESSPTESNTRRPQLDEPPPMPPGEGRRGSLIDSQKSLGPESGNPQIMALQGIQMMERGAQLIATGVPGLQDPLGQMVAFIRQAVPQAMAGGNPNQVPAAAPPPGALGSAPGGAPMMGPPPPPGGMQ